MSEYITVAGIVQFDPRTRQAAGKEVRDVAVRSIANHKMINITVWPEMDSVQISKGDFVVADGKYTQSTGQNKAGEQQTYHNLSASTFHNITGNSNGVMAGAAAGAASSDSTDDFPF
jgi:hypothetical protein